jgi:hypothetical protein
MHVSLFPRGPEVVTDVSAFGRDFVAMDLADTALAVAEAAGGVYRTPTECRRFADDLRGASALRCIVTQWIRPPNKASWLHRS